tara:strand:+ start:322 stop:837 length:516 start_codon:yes stop_codon:yes gene_type:complete
MAKFEMMQEPQPSDIKNTISDFEFHPEQRDVELSWSEVVVRLYDQIKRHNNSLNYDLENLEEYPYHYKLEPVEGAEPYIKISERYSDEDVVRICIKCVPTQETIEHFDKVFNAKMERYKEWYEKNAERIEREKTKADKKRKHLLRTELRRLEKETKLNDDRISEIRKQLEG